MQGAHERVDFVMRVVKRQRRADGAVEPEAAHGWLRAMVSGSHGNALSIQMPADGRTLEDVVRELLRPLLKQWLDENLPDIVQQTVDREVERIARGGVR